MSGESNKDRLFNLFKNFTNKTSIVEPIKTTYGTLRDKDAIEREIAHIISELLNERLFETSLTPTQLAKLMTGYYAGKTDNQIGRDLGNEQLSRTIGRARVRLKLFRNFDFNIPFSKEKMNELISSGKSLREISEILGVNYSSFRQFKHIYDSQDDKAIDTYIERITAVMEDRDLSEKMTLGMTTTGLSDTIDHLDAELAEDMQV